MMRRWLWILAASAATATAGAACEGALGAGGAGAGTPAPPDAMCDVLALLQRHCWSCHGTTLHDEAENSLVTLDQLKAPSAIDPSTSEAERCVIRMRATNKPMPPSDGPTVPEEAITLFQAWIDGGYKAASCGDSAIDPYATAATCSGEQLPMEQQEGEDMSPGRVCNTCHEQVNTEQGGDAPLFTLSGTVFKTAHEPDDCRSDAAKGAKVVVTDAEGKVVTVEVNEAGNFVYEDEELEFVFPYTAKVIFEGRERAMARPQMNGSCNECHTQTGTQEAPGRILLP